MYLNFGTEIRDMFLVCKSLIFYTRSQIYQDLNLFNSEQANKFLSLKALSLCKVYSIEKKPSQAFYEVIKVSVSL